MTTLTLWSIKFACDASQCLHTQPATCSLTVPHHLPLCLSQYLLKVASSLSSLWQIVLTCPERSHQNSAEDRTSSPPLYTLPHSLHFIYFWWLYAFTCISTHIHICFFCCHIFTCDLSTKWTEEQLFYNASYMFRVFVLFLDHQNIQHITTNTTIVWLKHIFIISTEVQIHQCCIICMHTYLPYLVTWALVIAKRLTPVCRKPL